MAPSTEDFENMLNSFIEGMVVCQWPLYVDYDGIQCHQRNMDGGTCWYNLGRFDNVAELMEKIGDHMKQCEYYDANKSR